MFHPQRITWLLLCGLVLYVTGCASNPTKEAQASRSGRTSIETERNFNIKPKPSRKLPEPPHPAKPPSIGGSEG